MARPDDIPADVWQVASDIFNGKHAVEGGLFSENYVVPMARAIIAAKAEEREACAVLAEAERLTGVIPVGTTAEEVAIMSAMVDVTGKSIAAAIRKRGEG